MGFGGGWAPRTVVQQVVEEEQAKAAPKPRPLGPENRARGIYPQGARENPPYAGIQYHESASGALRPNLAYPLEEPPPPPSRPLDITRVADTVDFRPPLNPVRAAEIGAKFARDLAAARAAQAFIRTQLNAGYRPREIDVAGTPHSDNPPFEPLVQGAQRVGGLAGRLALGGAYQYTGLPGSGLAGQAGDIGEQGGRVAGGIAGEQVATPAGAALLIGTGGFAGETNLLGRLVMGVGRDGADLLAALARQQGMKLEEYIASKQGQDALEALLQKRGIAPIAGASGEGFKKPQQFTFFRDEQGNIIPVEEGAFPAMPAPEVRAQGPFIEEGAQPVPQVAEPPAPFDLGTRPQTFSRPGLASDVGEGGQPVVQGIPEPRGKGQRPPIVGGLDAPGALLDRDAENHMMNFAARAEEYGADPVATQAVIRGYNNTQALASAGRSYLASSTPMQMVARAIAFVEGNVPDGVINRIAEGNARLGAALSHYADEWLAKNEGIYRVFDEEVPKLTYQGPKGRMAELASRHPVAAVVYHPEWFPEMPERLSQAMTTRREFLRGLYETTRAIDPRAAAALDGDYMRSVWGVPEGRMSDALARPLGRASVTKARTFPDPFEAMANPARWPYELTDTPLRELDRQSMHLSSRQAGTAMERKLMARRGWAVTHPRAGYVRYHNPNYAGHFGPPDVVNFMDQIYDPAASQVTALGRITVPIKNFVFGVGDFAVFGTHVLTAVGGKSFAVAGAAINRALERLALPHAVLYGEEDIPRLLQRELDGLPQGRAALSGFYDPERPGTILGRIPGLRRIDPLLTKWIEFVERQQFQNILQPIRNMVYEGNLLTEKMLGNDIADPLVQRRAADNALAFTGGSRGAVRRARRELEATALGAPQMTRSMVAQLGQVAKLNTPEAWLTLANFGAVVYGLGSAINMKFGSGDPIPLDPRRSDWASIRVGGHWEQMGGKDVYVGGRVVPLIPNRSLIRAIGKSMVAVEQMDGNAALNAWTQLAVARTTPGLQSGAGLAGIGFTREGRFTKDLPFEQRIQGLAPIPISGEQIIGGQAPLPTSPEGGVGTAAAFTGLAGYPGTTESSAERQGQSAARTSLAGSGFGKIEQQTWRGLTGHDERFKQYDSYDDWRKALVEDYTARNVEAGMSRPEAARAATAKAARNPLVRRYTVKKTDAEHTYWRQHPEELAKNVESGAWTPDAVEKVILARYRKSRPRALAGAVSR